MAKWVWTESVLRARGVALVRLQQVQRCSTRIRVSAHLLYMQVPFSPAVRLGAHQNIDHPVWTEKGRSVTTFQCRSAPESGAKANAKASLPVEIVEEGQQVEGQLAPAFLLTEGQDVGVHDGRGVVESRTAHHGPAHVPATEAPSATADRPGFRPGFGPTSRRGRPAAAGSGRA